MGKRAGRVVILLSALFLAACAQQTKEIPLEQQTPAQIFKVAEGQLANKKPAEAAKTFNEVERLYPYSDWAKRSIVMAAFSYHKAKKYDEARAAAQRYLDFYPADEDAAYAQYLMALSYYDQIDSIDRDQGNTFQALQALRVVIDRYPDSQYAKSAILKFDLAIDHLAGKEMQVGRYYLKRGFYTAAINRFRVVVEDYQTTTHTPEALYRLIEAYLSLGLKDEAQTAGAILGYNFKGSVWYKDGYALLTGKGLEAKAKGNGWIAKVYRRVIKGQWL